ncbi:MAG: ABC transporter ATP-binding protein [Chloroflexota bacterium]
MITVENLEYTYSDASTPAVRGLDFTIQPGEIFGFLGPSGAGKSTTQNILIGLLKGYQGHVSMMDRDLEKWGQDLYEQIGVTFELPNHYLKLTALENLNYFSSLYSGDKQDPMALLDMVGLAEDANKRVENFSKGMKMRLNFIRGLLNNPRLLFLDEPTTGLDPVNAANIKDIVRGLQAKGVTVFLTTHDMNVADDLCDRVAFIVDGQIKLIDSPKTLKISHGQRQDVVEYGLNGDSAQKTFALDDLADNAEFLDTLRTNHINTIHTQETTLERIFIEVTGKELA